MRNFLPFLVLLTVLTGCVSNEKTHHPRFEIVNSDLSKVDFQNTLTVNDSMNFFTYGYFYMGGGVATGDLNNDGLPDLYFTGNMSSNELYINKGDLKFENKTTESGVSGDDRWMTGCAFTDINADGWMDIYVSVAGKWKSRKNILYVNQGVNEDGVPTFIDMAEAYGLADDGNSIQSTFLDYDQDGDLDVFVANYEITPFNYISHDYKKLMDNVTHQNSDHLYRNNGDNTFTDVTESAGLLAFGLTIGIIASDFNQDGFTDLYLSNDFNVPDYFYLNNGDGTFTDHLKESTQHTAFYGMGVDAGDYNNDGILDLIQVDMAPADNFRSKANMGSMNVKEFWNNVNDGFHHQYMYNTLQQGMGVRQDGTPLFSDVAKISGMDKTDWSWSALFADYDNDGFKDVYITNGTRKDINNKDFFKWLERVDINLKIKYKELSIYDLLDKMPSKKVDNYIFKNIEGKGFEKYNDHWNLKFEGFSNGASYADLDNDGDLEIIVNNIDSLATIFENHTNNFTDNNYVKISLKGSQENPLGIGTKIFLKTDSLNLYHEHTLVRGFQSSVDPTIHLGVGSLTTIDEIKIQWPNGRTEVLNNVTANQLLEVDFAKSVRSDALNQSSLTTFVNVSDSLLESPFSHQENDFNDFRREVLLPHKMSQFGPALATEDVNGDGLEDFYIGGAKGHKGQLYLQSTNGTFLAITQNAFELDKIHEDVDAIFFDADQDGDKDLYVVSGGNESEVDSQHYQDRMYSNDGSGVFERVESAIPANFTSGGCVAAVDYDKDGDVDLFVGGRQVPGKYPLPANSYIYTNAGGSKISFIDRTTDIAPDLKEIGMVTSALWNDYDGDKDMDLVIVGEWMGITILENDGENHWDIIEVDGLEESTGWWNVIESADFDQDGDEDFIVGNLGLNYKYKADPEETFDVYVSDYDANGNLDIVLGYYQDGIQFPVRGKQCSSEQVPDLERKFTKYNKFAAASLGDIYTTGLLENSLHYKAQEFANVYIENLGDGKFMKHTLPTEIQTSSINSLEVLDYDNDGNLDFIAGGNFFVSEVETPRNDASYGWLLKGNGRGGFESVPLQSSGIDTPYDNRKVRLIDTAQGAVVLFANNDGPLTSFRLRR